ncbi:MAG: DNA mismatch repair endonuclease MutL [Sedimentisphaerales bacterium]|nr:DNA mismatch repair endonuclease MutL [Sedimentisphaerales bacterium]
MGRIVVLDRNMVNMIAAGEVIERPASVVKELTENSIDAGATKITIAVEDGGRKLISVSDNGSGMDAEDLGRAFEPHATSKIRTSTDLACISTLGFRGEALASIASVAQVRAVSRTEGSPGANCVEIDCGTRGDVGPCSGDYGTTIQVRDIFYKLPARRKFLRTGNTEMGHIAEQFTRIALGCCGQDADSGQAGLDLTLIRDGKEVLRLTAGQGLLERINALFPMLSGNPSNDFIQARTSERGLEICALLGKPVISRTSNKFQYVFLNGRCIRDKFISHAIREAYRGLLEPNRFGVAFLFIKMPFEDYDVNVHPTKSEVRFYNANLVHSQILGTIREKLLGTNLDIEARLPAATGSLMAEESPAGSPRGMEITDAMADFFKKHRPGQRQRQFGFGGGRHSDAERSPATTVIEAPPGQPIPKIPAERKRFLQIHDSFIVAQTDDGFIIVDQHALHERVMYEDLRNRVQHGNLESQRLLIPQSFELNDSQAAIIEENSELIEKLGIELVPFGPRTIAVQAFPSLLAKADPLDFVQDLIDLLERQGPGPNPQRLLDEVLNMAACKAAIKAGQRLTDSEMEQLLLRRDTTESASRCPHGRPTTLKFSLADLEKQFKRT